MTDPRSAWKDAADRLEGLALKLKLHYEQQRGVQDEEARARTEDAVKRLTGAVRDAFDAIGDAAKDSAVKDDVRKVGESLTDALSATFGQVSDEFRRAFNRSAGGPTSTGASTDTDERGTKPDGGT